jgi:hypothetical protein
MKSTSHDSFPKLDSDHRHCSLNIPVNVNKGRAIYFGSKSHENGQSGRPRPRWKNNTEVHSMSAGTNTVI